MRLRYLKTMLLGACGLLVACVAPPSGPAVLAQPARPSCEALSQWQLAATKIGLPTGGAKVDSALWQPVPGAQTSYCRIQGRIEPVDPAAPAILFEVGLPANWNSKSLHLGGGGYNGTVVAATGNVPAPPLDAPLPLARGYATFGSDSGHEAAPPYSDNPATRSLDARFLQNDEALRNFAGDALKKTRDVATALQVAFYGRAPSQRYFAGGSTGGREALAVVQRWPDDYDGAISAYPAWNAATLDLAFGRITQALSRPGAYPGPAKQALLYQAQIAACDTDDGARDGLISRPAACGFALKSLRCAKGRDLGDTCLSDAQIAAITTMATPMRLQYPLASGETAYPGFNVLSGADLRSFLGWHEQAPTSPAQLGQPYMSQFWDQWVRYAVVRDPAFDSRRLDPERAGPYVGRISALTSLQDVNRTDLSRFAGRGGKLIVMHGAADALVSTRATIAYMDRVKARMGDEQTGAFTRFYVIPGYGHVNGAFKASWDSLTALDHWVVDGVAPVAPVVADANAGMQGRTRPLCLYPAWPRYRSGDVNAAASFECVKG
ncbi:feruloyl esterase [Jeongeupia sp. HS-3]|uniref:tannase/feruloyl esterase family alpha/beta hydrolase n=1 Tax=Jeongeupia sp. HS-3 TaxID=1009682 RepID=UPI0018A59B87|nr:tannase/feruloyl esterase family alpha/beta hydrolase [Jeongeupia sp. HS-3]BCL74598.1 feruloyl esterase [Jeongeupia sp. HS-3]